MQFIFSSSLFFLSPSSASSFIFFFPSSELSSSFPGIRNRRALSFDAPSTFFCPHISVAGFCWWRYWAEIGVDRRELAEGGVPTERADEVVVEHAARQVALVERGVGAAGQHREVHHVGQPAEHLFVNGAEVNFGESCGCGRW